MMTQKNCYVLVPAFQCKTSEFHIKQLGPVDLVSRSRTGPKQNNNRKLTYQMLKKRNKTQTIYRNI